MNITSLQTTVENFRYRSYQTNHAFMKTLDLPFFMTQSLHHLFFLPFFLLSFFFLFIYFLQLNHRKKEPKEYLFIDQFH